MKLKSDFKTLKNYFILGQIAVFFAAMCILFWTMALGYREKVLHILMSRLESSVETMAGQLKANQVPFSAGAGEHGVFIINQNDGTMVVNRQDDTDTEQKLWERYRTKLIYEMQKQKRGWIVYPDKTPWDWGQRQKIIRYLSIDELNWILAIEVPRPAELELLKEAIKPSLFLVVLFILFSGAAALWFMANVYGNVIRQQIADAVEHNFMSLSGEEKIWDKGSGKESVGLEFQPKAAQVPDPLKPMHPSGPAPSPSAEPGADEAMRHIDEHEALLVKKSKTFKEEPPFKMPETLGPAEEKTLKNFVEEGPDADRLTINVHNIKSAALKKIIQQFRSK